MKSTADAGSRKCLDEAEWNRIAASAEFQGLLAMKKVFIVPAFAFFLFYYLLLPVLVGYAPKLMSMPVIGSVTLAYLFALSQFIVGWIIAWLYLRAAARFDKLVQHMLEQGSVTGREDECRSRS